MSKSARDSRAIQAETRRGEYELVMRGRYSNIDASESVVDVARFRDGLIHSVTVFSTKDEALASLVRD